MNSTPQFNLSLIRAEKRARFNPLADLEPDTLTRHLQEFRSGHLQNLARVMDAIEETDDTLTCVCGKAKSAVARHGWEILTVDTEDEDKATEAERQKEALEYFYNNLRATSALDQDELGGLSLLVRQMMDARGKRYAVHNLVWKPAEDGRYTVTAHFVPLWFFENTEGRMRFISQPYGYYGVDMEPAAWLVTKGAGLNIACAVAWMYKHLPLRDWLIYSARHGMPGIEGVTDAPEGSAEWNVVKTAVEAASSDFKWIRNRSAEIKTIDFSAQGQLPYPPLVERMDRAMSAIWRGADLSTMSAGSGAGQGASLQGEEKDATEQDDCQWISETLNLKLDRLVLDLIFGPDAEALAYIRIAGAQKQDIDRDLKIDQAAIIFGHPISKKQFSERYNRPLPDAEDDLLGQPASQAGVSPAPFSAAASGVSPAPFSASDAEKVRTAPATANEAEKVRTDPATALALARAQDLAPLRERLDAILKIQDPAIRRWRLAALSAELPQLLADLNADPAQARVFEDYYRTALAAGLTGAKAEV